VMSRYASDK